MSNATNYHRLVPIAPAASGAAPLVQPAETSMPYTCLTCTRRKVKCDKVAPVCSTCRKSALECVYQAPAPRKRKRKPVDEIHERLEHYEKLLKQSGILPQSEETSKSDVDELTPASGQTEPATADDTGPIKSAGAQLHVSQGKTRYINAGFWRNLDDLEYQPSSDEDDDDETEGYVKVGHQSAIRDPLSSAILGPSSPATSLLDAHPTYEAAMKLWTIYVDNVDPVCKVLHVPTAQKVLQRAASNPSSASKATEAVMFAVYHIALESITERECQETFFQARSVLQPRYLDALRQALVNAQFLKTTDISVVQAYTLYLLSVRGTHDPQTFWVLTGVAVRLGQRLGLHLDGVERQLNPFDVQMRRRVFWQLLPLDGIASQKSGTGIALTFDSWDTRQPLNINDKDIWPGMDHTPEPREGATDMIFCLARTELAKFFKDAAPRSSDWSRFWESDSPEQRQKHQQMIKEIEESMEEKYIRFCDISDPIHCLTLLMARSAATVGTFRIRLPFAKKIGTSEEDRTELWASAVKWLDIDAACNQNALLKRYRWHLDAIFLWEPLIWVLYELRREPARFHSERIWSKIDATILSHPAVLVMRRSLHIALGRLALKAWDVCRNIKLEDSPFPMQTEPAALEKIRQALAKRKESRNRPTPPSTKYNPFDPAQDATTDLPDPSPVDFGTSDVSTGAWALPDLQMEATDWMFWDQLIHDPNASSFLTP